MKPFCEMLTMPDARFRIKSFYSSQFEHVEVHPHWHSEVEILYVIEGCATQQVNERYFTTETGDITIIGKDQLHSTYSYQNSRCNILVLQFDAQSLLNSGSLVENDRTEDIYASCVHFNNPIRAAGGSGERLKEAILDINDELAGRQSGYKPLVRSRLLQIAGLLTREDLYRLENGSSKELRFIREMLEKTFKLIDDSYSEDIGLSDAAEASNLSMPHFCRLFKKATGMTFNAYLSFYRVNRAEKLLNSDLTLASIAMECGFGSVSSFIRSFKKYKNCTPSECKRLA